MAVFSYAGVVRVARGVAGRVFARPCIPWKTRPISDVFGLDRGLPIDRYYIRQFLSANASVIRGRVLEFGDNHYFREFSAPGSSLDIFDVSQQNASATIVGDLGSPSFLEVRKYAFDCIICTQVLQFIYPVGQAIENLYAMLRPGGVLLASSSGISQISRFDMDRWGEYWRFTSLALKKMFGSTCGGALVEVLAYGNVLAAVTFLHGLAAEEIASSVLDRRDPNYELTICVRCVKGE